VTAAWDRQAACSGVSLRAGEPLAGTAPTTPTWVLIGHPGPWGAKAPATARGRLGPALAQACGGRSGTSLVLVRPAAGAALAPDRKARVLTGSGSGLRTCWAVTCGPGQPSLERADLTDDDLLSALPEVLDALATGRSPGWMPVSESLRLVCANARRDPCCGVLGRPAGAALRDLPAPESGVRPTVLESSHLGGHRFAPVVLDLPSGWMFGRIGLTGSPVLGIDEARGRVSLAMRLQAAEIAALRAAGLSRPVRCAVSETDGEVTVVTPDGRRWHVRLTEVPIPPTAASCGRPAEAGVGWLAETCPAGLSGPR